MANRKLQSADLSAFCAQVALMLSSGIPLYDGLQALAEAAQGSPEETIFSKLHADVMETGSLCGAMQRDSMWPAYIVEMTGIGERAGCLEKIMERLAVFYDRETRIRGAVRSAVTYPLVLGVMMLLIVLVLIVKVLPVFRRVLGSMGIALSDSGGWLMRTGTTAGWVVLVLVGVFVLAALAAVIALRTGAKERVLDALTKIFPPFARLRKKLSAARVASVLSMLLSGGFPLIEALELLPGVLDDAGVIAEVTRIREGVAKGSGFAETICASALFEPLHSRMVRIGAAAGREDEVMETIARVYEEDVENGVARLVSIIEPTLVALLCVVIGAILLSVMLPMAGIISSIF